MNSQYVFWEKCSEFLQETTAVHERRHGDTCFMAKAISVRDLLTQITCRCPEGTQIPSESSTIRHHPGPLLIIIYYLFLFLFANIYSLQC